MSESPPSEDTNGSGGSHGDQPLNGAQTTTSHRSGADEPWPLPDPNQVGSGWTEAEISTVNPPAWDIPDRAEGPDAAGPAPAPPIAVATGPTSAEIARNELAQTYDELVNEVLRLRRLAEEGSDSSSGSEGLPADDDDDGGHLLWFHAYLEYVKLQRRCAVDRIASGQPPVQCTRHSPCTTCRQHDGAYVPSSYWHTMSDSTLEQHLEQYERIRHRLPPWRSNVQPPALHSGAQQTPATVIPGSVGGASLEGMDEAREDVQHGVPAAEDLQHDASATVNAAAPPSTVRVGDVESFVDPSSTLHFGSAQARLYVERASVSISRLLSEFAALTAENEPRTHAITPADPLFLAQVLAFERYVESYAVESEPPELESSPTDSDCDLPPLIDIDSVPESEHGSD